jgi:general secretion pathway protein D/MSHA biogenesis protein MshL
MKMYSNMNKLNNRFHRIRHYTEGIFLLFLIIGLMTGCVASKQSRTSTPEAQPQTDQGIKDVNASSQAEVQPEEQSVPYSAPASSRPPVSWQPSFTVEDIQVKESALGLPELKVGANIESQSGKVVLRDIIKGLANLKGFNVSWNQDANPNVMVDVDIKANDDFWVALDNVLRQLDYFFEFKNDTLIIGYKQTKTYQVAMPNVSYTFTTAIGGNMLGGATNTDNLGEISLATVPTEEQETEGSQTRYINRYDLWKSFRQNLNQILEIWEPKTPEREEIAPTVQAQPRPAATQAQQTPTPEPSGPTRSGKGSFTIDESLGIVTVNAPPSLQKHVADYINTFKSWLYRQIAIRADVIEVLLSEESSRGIDWTKVLKASERDKPLIGGSVTFGDSNKVYYVDYSGSTPHSQEGIRLVGEVDLSPIDFNLLVNALEEQGTVRTLSQPRLNLLNGSPGVLTVGESVRYISKVTAKRSGESGQVDYDVETEDVMSGLSFSVVCNVLGDDEVVLYLTPVISNLREMEYTLFGAADVEIGLPKVALRQMTTMAKVRNGDMLILGGLINELTIEDNIEVPFLGRIPWVKWAFRNEYKKKERAELIIILRPHILPM